MATNETSQRDSSPADQEQRRRRMPLEMGDETELNMTPMIDIVFQLIIFFLITLKFKTIDERIDANLPPVGMLVGPPPQEQPKIKLKVFRKHKADPERAYTLVRIDNTHRIPLPQGSWAGKAVEDHVRLRDYDRAVAQIRAVLVAKADALGRAPDLCAEIVAPPPDGGAVPEGDVIRLVDTLVDVGLTDIRFEGSTMPGGPLGR